ncbi:MAG: GNAT family N-acetyltransferase [Chlamydiia bacterium]|nr:GNAT family N-acetyltransferase [Chlamydiia bacterium]
MIKQASLQDLSFFLNAAKKEGWNPGLSDADPFFAADPKGFFIEQVDGKTIGSISAVAYNNDYGFMGFYIVQPDYRGKGYGMKLWSRAIDYLGNRAIGLDGVVEQQENYKKSGFTFHNNNIRFSGIIPGKPDASLVTLQNISYDILEAYDTQVVGYDRTPFLKEWIKMPNAVCLAKTKSGTLQGYGVIRKCFEGYKIGPLFADTPEIAESLLLALAAETHGDTLFLDVVQTHNDALKLAEKYHLKKVFETARMYKGTPPTQDLSKVFGITTFELG